MKNLKLLPAVLASLIFASAAFATTEQGTRGNPVSGTLMAVGDTVTVTAPSASTVGVVVGADTNVTLVPEASVDGANWQAVAAFPAGTNGAGVTSIASTGSWFIPSGGVQAVRLRASIVGATPAASVTLYGSPGINSNAGDQAVQSAQSGIVATAPATGVNGQQLSLALDQQGGLIEADETRIPPASCSSACANTTLFSADTWGYNSIAVDVSSIGGGVTITFQVSNDNSNWFSTRCQSSAIIATNSLTVSTTAATGLFSCDTKGKYFRAQMTAYTSGTITAGGLLRAAPFVPMVSAVTAALPSGSNIIGKIGIDQTTNGTTNAVTLVGYSFTHISTNATTTAKSGAGFLHTLCINTKGASANTATIYDNTTGSGTIIGAVDTTSGVQCQRYDVAFATGLTIVTATGTAADLTASWR